MDSSVGIPESSVRNEKKLRKFVFFLPKFHFVLPNFYFGPQAGTIKGKGIRERIAGK